MHFVIIVQKSQKKFLGDWECKFNFLEENYHVDKSK